MQNTHAKSELIAFGHLAGEDVDSPVQLGEVTLVANPNALRRIARFFNHVAQIIEQSGERFNHDHLDFFDPTFKNIHNVQLVVAARKNAEHVAATSS